MPVCLKTGSGRESLPLGRGSKPWLWGAWEPRTELHRLPADASATEWKKSVRREGPGVALRVSKGRGRCKQCAEGPPRAGAGGPGRGRGLAPGGGVRHRITPRFEESAPDSRSHLSLGPSSGIAGHPRFGVPRVGLQRLEVIELRESGEAEAGRGQWGKGGGMPRRERGRRAAARSSRRCSLSSKNARGRRGAGLR